ncbi:MAG: aminodeoxychorismate synthase component I [Syntrophobacteraceae bacterium]
MKMPLPDPRSVHLDRLDVFEGMDDSNFLRRAEGTVSQVPSAMLLSGGPLAPLEENRYSIAAWDPFMVLRSKGDNNLLETAGQRFEIRANPLEVLDRVFESLNPSFPLEIPPFCGGAVGYLAYDLKNSIERLPTSATDDLDLPDLFLFWPGHIAVHDRKEKKLHHATLQADGESRSLLRRREFPMAPHPTPLKAGALSSNFAHTDYLSAVSKIRSYIGQGDIYQVNLSQRFHFSIEGNPFQLWQSLFNRNPAPFYAYINAGNHQILSTSMERFLLRRKDFIETRPIKGTRKRGKTREEDEALALELLASPKDDAELSMIVDLLRNDLGRICNPGTIRVAEHKRLETYQNVHHLVSIVTGELRPDISPGGIIRAAFPGGSITGCPKIRAMEIIDELEPNVRHVYTGAIGYLGWHRNLDLNIAIRTAIVKDQTCYFSVGGGIVHDSVEEDEYQETLHKGRTLFEVIKTIGSPA